MMKKFQDLVKEYEFVSLEELVCDVVDTFKEEDLYDMTIVVSAYELQDYLTALISTGVFSPVMIEWDKFDDLDYSIVLYKYGDFTEMMIEKYRDDGESIIEDTDLMVSKSVKTSTFKKILKRNKDFIHFDIEE